MKDMKFTESITRELLYERSANDPQFATLIAGIEKDLQLAREFLKDLSEVEAAVKAWASHPDGTEFSPGYKLDKGATPSTEQANTERITRHIADVKKFTDEVATTLKDFARQANTYHKGKSFVDTAWGR